MTHKVSGCHVVRVPLGGTAEFGVEAESECRESVVGALLVDKIEHRLLPSGLVSCCEFASEVLGCDVVDGVGAEQEEDQGCGDRWKEIHFFYGRELITGSTFGGCVGKALGS